MSRSFDHLVLTVDDLDVAAAFYARLGFTLTPRARHPFGTDNRLAQLQGCFLELLAVARPDDIAVPGPGAVSFGAYTRDFLAGGQGMGMMVLRTTDAAADRDDFKAAGLDTYEMFEFSRQAGLPDGTEATVGFTLAFASVPGLPEALAFTCQQWRPDLFWKPEYQRHANGAATIDEVFLVTDDRAPAERLRDGLDLDQVGGKLTILTPDAFGQRFPGTAGRPGRFGGFRVAVDDLEAVRTCMAENDIPYEDAADSLWVAPEHGFGCVIEFGEPS
ncbi:MAG: VOC family protein [Rhodospirillaceae bacterium]